MLGFVGEVAAMKVRGNRTEILAATPSYWAEKTPLGRTLDFPNTRPSDALFEAAGTLPYPDIDIPLTERPKVRRTGPDSFQWTSTVSGVYEAVREETGLALIDTPLGVATGRRSVAVHASSASRWTFTEGLDFPDGELEVSESPVVIERTEAEEAGDATRGSWPTASPRRASTRAWQRPRWTTETSRSRAARNFSCP